MKANYLIILAIMAVASYMLFIRRPKSKPAEGNSADTNNDSSTNTDIDA
jgi:hypothetical protein